MKPDVRKKVRGDRIEAILPPAIRSRFPANARSPDAAFTALVFPHTQEDVVRWRPVVKALARVREDARVVAVAGNFTEEARQALSERGAIVLTLGWWLRERCPEPSAEGERRRLDLHVTRTPLGDLPLAQVTPAALDGRLREMERDGAAPPR